LLLLIQTSLVFCTLQASSWKNSGEGDWLDPDNWDGGLPWGGQWGGQSAVIQNGGTVIFDNADTTVNPQTVDVDIGRLVISSGTVSPIWYVTVGGRSGDVGYLEVNGGRIVGGWDNNFTIGSAGEGTLTVRNDGVVESDWLFLGGQVHRGITTDGGTGHLFLSDNAQIIDTNGIVIAAGANTTGSAVIAGNSLMKTGGHFYVGYCGKADVTISGGLVQITGATSLGYYSTANATLTLSGGVLETTSVVKGAGQAALVFDGGTLRARGNHSSFISGLSSVSLLANGGVIDSNGFNITVRSGFVGEGTLGKAGTGTLTLVADSTVGGIDLRQGAFSLGAGNSITVIGGTGLLAIRSGTVFEMSGTDAAQSWLTALDANGRLLLEGGALLKLNPEYSHIQVSFLELQAGSTNKVAIELKDFQGLPEGQRLKILEYETLLDDYGVGSDADAYFTLTNPADGEAYYFEWDENALYLVRGIIPEPAVTALVFALISLAAARRCRSQHRRSLL